MSADGERDRRKFLMVFIADARGATEEVAVYTRLLKAFPHVDAAELELRCNGGGRYTATARAVGTVECVACHVTFR